MAHLGLDKAGQGHDRDRRTAPKVPQGDILERRLRDRRLAEVLKQFKGTSTKLNAFQITD